MHGLSMFLRSNVLSIAMLACGVVATALTGCGLSQLWDFAPRSAQAQGGDYSKTKSFEANAQLALDAQAAGTIADALGDFTPLANSIGGALKKFGEQLAVNTERLDEVSKTRTITNSDVLQSQAYAALVAFGISRLRLKPPVTPAAG